LKIAGSEGHGLVGGIATIEVEGPLYVVGVTEQPAYESVHHWPLLVHALVNHSLWRLKVRGKLRAGEGPCYPIWLPLTGGASCVGFVAVRAYLYLAGGL